MEPIRVGIADDHLIVRSGLREFVGSQPDLKVVGEASHGRAAIDLVRAIPMDVLILDIAMPTQSGVDAIGMIRAKAPLVNLLVLSGFPAAAYALKLMGLGARGYLNKQCEPQEILQAIRTVATGRRYMQSELGALMADEFGAPQTKAPHTTLGPKEFQVFVRLAQGQKSEQIAMELSLGLKTVSTYRGHIMAKLGLHTNSDITHYAMRHGLID